MEPFPDASSYYQHLKPISDQLSNVGAPVSNEKLVHQIIFGITNVYATIGWQIRHIDSLLHFYKSRPMIILEEITKEKKTAGSIENSDFLSSQDDVSASIGHNRNKTYSGCNNSARDGRQVSCNGRGKGRHNG